MPKIVNSEYKRFVKTGLINLIKPPEFKKMLDNVEHAKLKQARALLIMLYYTGRRPSELVSFRVKDFLKKGLQLQLTFETKKGGRANILYLSLSKRNKLEFLPELWAYLDSFRNAFPETFVFWAFRDSPNHKKRVIKVKSKKTGFVKSLEYPIICDRVKYYVLKWTGLPPYFFRHNRFSSMAAKGASLNQIKNAKGAKTFESVYPYVHLSTTEALKTSKFIE